MKRETHHGNEFTKQEFFVCDCHNWQHNIVVEVDRMDWGEKFDDDRRLEDSLSFHVQMNHFLPWYKRAARAVLYIFAKDAKWYHWSETLVSKSDAIRMRELLTEYIESPYTRDK